MGVRNLVRMCGAGGSGCFCPRNDRQQWGEGSCLFDRVNGVTWWGNNVQLIMNKEYARRRKFTCPILVVVLQREPYTRCERVEKHSKIRKIIKVRVGSLFLARLSCFSLSSWCSRFSFHTLFLSRGNYLHFAGVNKILGCYTKFLASVHIYHGLIEILFRTAKIQQFLMCLNLAMASWCGEFELWVI